jgi:hypothetical protein
VVVLLEAVAAVFQEEELEERQGLVPGVALSVVWVSGLGSQPFINTTNGDVVGAWIEAANDPKLC